MKKGLSLILVILMLCSAASVFAGTTVDSAMYGDERASGANTPVEEIEEIFTSAGISDVQSDYWAAGSIALLVDLGFMAPASDGKFNPEEELTNLSAVSLFAKVLGIADKNDSAEVAMQRAKENDLVSADTTSSDSMSRMDMAKLLINALGIEPIPVTAADFRDIFTDGALLSSADRAILNALYQAGYIKGYGDNTYHPRDILSRAEIAIIIDRILSSSN